MKIHARRGFQNLVPEKQEEFDKSKFFSGKDKAIETNEDNVHKNLKVFSGRITRARCQANRIIRMSFLT